jgi:hypothetical protein
LNINDRTTCATKSMIAVINHAFGLELSLFPRNRLIKPPAQVPEGSRHDLVSTGLPNTVTWNSDVTADTASTPR